jgi:hypothetical protein
MKILTLKTRMVGSQTSSPAARLDGAPGLCKPSSPLSALLHVLPEFQ